MLRVAAPADLEPLGQALATLGIGITLVDREMRIQFANSFVREAATELTCGKDHCFSSLWHEAHRSSAQNVLPGTVAARRDEGPLVRVVVDCGVRLVALVTRASAERLALAPGRRVLAVVKAPCVRIVPRPG